MDKGDSDKLKELCVLYTRTKKYVLLAEQVDPESRSNIAIFKEQRDALDHVMRALWDKFGDPAPDSLPDPYYYAAQVDKAKGHLFRAAYDALDGVGVSSKIRLEQAMRGISNDAITAVYPQYYEHVVEIDELDRKIAEHRNSKDIGRSTLANLESYALDVERLHGLAKECVKKAPAFKEWAGRNNRKVLVFTVGVPVALVLLGAWLRGCIP